MSKMKKCLNGSLVLLTLVVSSLNSTKVLALESDQFMTWGVDMVDLEKEINDHVNSTVEQAISEISKKKKKKNEALSCEDVRRFSLLKFRGLLIHKIETWLEHHHGNDMYPVVEKGYPYYFKNSIYNFSGSTIARLFPMGRNLNINGVIIGADKLAHFFSTGVRYYESYLKNIKKGMDPTKATRKAIDAGITMERTYLGLWPAGVFSFGDLEANYQGMQLNYRFCNGPDTYLKQNSEGTWEMVKKIDMGQYINPNMNETFNRSYFGVLKWLKVKPMLKKYCEKSKSPEVVQLLNSYAERVKKSFNIKYLEELESIGDSRIPDRKAQSFGAICD